MLFKTSHKKLNRKNPVFISSMKLFRLRKKNKYDLTFSCENKIVRRVIKIDRHCLFHDLQRYHKTEFHSCIKLNSISKFGTQEYCKKSLC